MKRLFAILLLLIVQLASAQNSAGVPDIIVDSKLDFNWSDMLMQKIRRLMVNKGLGDPLKSQVETEMVVVDSLSGELVSPQTKLLLKDLSQMIGIRLLNVRSKIVLKNFYYNVGSVTTDLKTSRKTAKGIIIDGDFAAGKIKVASDEIRLILEIPGADGKVMPVVQIKIKKPFFLTEGNTQLTVGAAVQIIENKEDIRFQVLQSDFNKIADLLHKEPESIQLGFEDLVIPKVSVTIGTKVVTIEPEKVKNFIAKREDQLKSLLLDQLKIKLKEGANEPFAKLLDNLSIPREHWLNAGTVASQFKIGKINSNAFDKNLEINLPADFCTSSRFQSFNKNCVNLKETKTPTSLITEDNHRRSIDDIKDSLSGDVNLVASISEDYLNKLMGATFDAGLYSEMLAEADAALGPRRAFIRLDEKGDTGTLYADVIYNIKGFTGFVLGQKQIRFPLVLKCSMRIEKKAGNIPVLLIRMVDADLSDQILRHGIPALNMQSTIQDVPRFKGKVLKTIKEKLNKFLGKDVLSLNYPEFQGLGLETVNFSSDGNGRLGAHVRLEELLRVEEDDNKLDDIF